MTLNFRFVVIQAWLSGQNAVMSSETRFVPRYLFTVSSLNSKLRESGANIEI